MAGQTRGSEAKDTSHLYLHSPCSPRVAVASALRNNGKGLLDTLMWITLLISQSNQVRWILVIIPLLQMKKLKLREGRWGGKISTKAVWLQSLGSQPPHPGQDIGFLSELHKIHSGLHPMMTSQCKVFRGPSPSSEKREQ